MLYAAYLLGLGGKVMAIKLNPSQGMIDLGQKLAKGDPGPIGPQGPKGEPGIYVGTEAPQDDSVLVWLDDSQEGLGLDNYATKEYVDNKNVALGQELTAYMELYFNDIIAFNDATYAKKEEIPDVSQYQTAEDVETAITNALSAIGVAEEGAY